VNLVLQLRHLLQQIRVSVRLAVRPAARQRPAASFRPTLTTYYDDFVALKHQCRFSVATATSVTAILSVRLSGSQL